MVNRDIYGLVILVFGFFVVLHYIYIFSSQIFIVYHVVHPIINGEVKGGEPNVGTFVVPNVYTSQESMVLVLKVEGRYESPDI